MAVTKYFLFPWAVNGDLQTGGIPNPLNTSGYVSYQQGFTFDYQRNLSTDAQAKSIQRTTINSVLNDVTVAMQQLQQSGAPDWISATANGGTAFAYDQGALVRYSSGGVAPFAIYANLVQGNTATPGADASWQNMSKVWASSTPIRPIIGGDVFDAPLASSTVYTSTLTFTAPCDGWIDVQSFAFIPGVTDAFFGMSYTTENVSSVVNNSDNLTQQFIGNGVLTGLVSAGAAVTVNLLITTQAAAINPAYYIGCNQLLRFTPARGVDGL